MQKPSSSRRSIHRQLRDSMGNSNEERKARDRTALFHGYSFLLLWLLLLIFVFHDAHGADSGLAPYAETAETFVEYPDIPAVTTLMEADKGLPSLQMSIWSSPIEFQDPLYSLIKGIVRRLDKDLLEFQPNYVVADGASKDCRVADAVTGDESGNMSNPYCVENCTNHGRYCAAVLPNNPALASKVSGHDIVVESLRRLCVWYVQDWYY